MKKRAEKPAAHAAILLEIEERFGIVTPKMVVDLAKDPNHPLHSQFEWRDDVAAQRFREEQARELIRNARLNVVVQEVSIEAHAFIRDPTSDSDKQGYRSVLSLHGDRQASIEALAQEVRQAAALLRRCRDIGTSLGLDTSEIQKFEAGVEGLAATLATSIAAEKAA